MKEKVYQINDKVNKKIAVVTIKLNPKREMPVIGIRIIDREYADDFINRGVIHFSSPSDWTSKDKASGHQLDVYEGCFCYSKEDNDEALRESGREFTKNVNNGSFRYFSDSSKIMACCFYGINKSSFKKGITKYGVDQIDSYDLRVERTYFDKFNDKRPDEKSVILIFDMPAFVNRLCSAFIEFGFKASDILLCLQKPSILL